MSSNSSQVKKKEKRVKDSEGNHYGLSTECSGAHSPLHRRSGIPQILCGGSGPLERTERTSCPAPSGVVRDQYGKRDEVGG